jgi:serpin B
MSNKRRVRVIAAAVALGATLAACGAGHEVVASPSAPVPSATPGATATATSSPTPAGQVPHRVTPGADAPIDATVAGLEKFAAAFYAVAAEKGENFVFSPLSVAYAFAMLQEGAKGETKTQIDKAFGFPDGVGEAFNALTKGLVTSTAPPVASPRPSADSDPPPAKPVLTIANALFAQAGYAFEQPFLDTLGQQYGSTMQSTDFRDTTAALAAINHWADVHTAGRIKEVFTSLDPSTRLVLANAVYLKASWTQYFQDAGKQDFKAAGGIVSTPMMRRADENFGYATGTNWQAVTLPYFGGRLAMRVILPTGSATPADLMKPSVLDAAATTKSTAVNVTMPPFDFASNLDLEQLLPKLGITGAFDPNSADLSGITTAEQLFIYQAVHKANITVDRLGTVASAVTALAAMPASARIQPVPPIEFTVDRPFVFEIVDTKTGAPLFTDSVADPTAK